jgi:hypothetical protein
MAHDDSSDAHEPLLEDVGETTVQVDDLITQGNGPFREEEDGESIPDERYLRFLLLNMLQSSFSAARLHVEFTA